MTDAVKLSTRSGDDVTDAQVLTGGPPSPYHHSTTDEPNDADATEDRSGVGVQIGLDLEERWLEAGASETWKPPQRRRRWAARAALAGIVILAAVVVIGAVRLRHDDQVNAARNSALDAASADAAMISTYSYQDFDSYAKRISANSTKAFAANFAKDSTALGSILKQYQAGSKGTVVGAGLGRGATATKATVYVFLNETVSNSKNPSQTERARMVVTLVRQGGRWLVANAVVQ